VLNYGSRLTARGIRNRHVNDRVALILRLIIGAAAGIIAVAAIGIGVAAIGK
jgi:hypothetical protein